MEKYIGKQNINNETYSTYYHEFHSLSEVSAYIKNTKRTQGSIYAPFGNSSIKGDYNFTGTHSFEEAQNLMLYGWEQGTVALLNGLKEVKHTSLKQKTIYDVQGFQCSVPRYLQGIPTNMVNKKNITIKNKIITINKSICYASGIGTETIINESLKVLRLVNTLENKDYRVNLNIINIFRNRNKLSGEQMLSISKVLLKPSSRRLNVKQVAFPLVHPSMHRRIFFALFERYRECDYKQFYYGYGKPLNSVCFVKNVLKQNEYYIPAIVEEEEIIDIEKYRVQ